ncbi:carboxypeptidase B [Caerostris darwini]|uniref:Carboxypeptidase B n=1 Tax=Caerostris darwini TaxID=1538125 RepID=A0AAV4X8R2_9ARAC|nr:carboxypeptidase B [Caerostris darwini]
MSEFLAVPSDNKLIQATALRQNVWKAKVQNICIYKRTLNLEKMFLIVLLLSAVLPVFSTSHVNFTGHKLYGLFASDDDELKLLKGLIEHPEIDVWNEPVDLYEKVNVRVPPNIAGQFEDKWKSEGIDYYVVTNNIQKWIDEEREENPVDDALAGRQENFQLDVYHTFDAVRPGTSGDSCSEIFRGEGAFSEEESKAVRDGVLSIGPRLKAYFTLHSYSQLWMTPYGHSREVPPDYQDQMKALQAAANAIASVHGQYYRHGTIANTIYPAAGSSVDWAYEKARIKYSFAIELRDTGRQGFLLSNSQIIPNAEENFAGIKAVADIIRNEV